MNTYLDLIANHAVAFESAGAALAVAAVCTMPAKVPWWSDTPPQLLQELWTWMRETLQTAIPAARHHTQNPIPAVAPPNK